jgi:hypothetical protein
VRFPNSIRGRVLVLEHGSIDDALKRLHPLSGEYDDVIAYQWVSTGVKPEHWTPPVVRAKP